MEKIYWNKDYEQGIGSLALRRAAMVDNFMRFMSRIPNSDRVRLARSGSDFAVYHVGIPYDLTVAYETLSRRTRISHGKMKVDGEIIHHRLLACGSIEELSDFGKFVVPDLREYLRGTVVLVG